MEYAATGAAKDVGRALQLLSRAVRARQTQGVRSGLAVRAMAELHTALSSVLEHVDRLSVSVFADRMQYGDQIVLSETNAQESITQLLHDNGVRRVDFSRGLDPSEL